MIKINETCYQDNLVNYECYDCEKNFILGEELTKECKTGFPKCPYCGSTLIEWVSMTEDDQLEELGLGCIGLYIVNQFGEENL